MQESAYSELLELIAVHQEIENKVIKQVKPALKSIIKGFFADHPEVSKVVWDQFTPYFNDGEPCVFQVGEPSVWLNPDVLNTDGAKINFFNENFPEDYMKWEYKNGLSDKDKVKEFSKFCSPSTNQDDEDEVGPYEDGEEGLGVWSFHSDKESKFKTDFSELMDTINKLEPYMQSVFGDHVRVSCDRQGFHISDCYHD